MGKYYHNADVCAFRLQELSCSKSFLYFLQTLFISFSLYYAIAFRLLFLLEASSLVFQFLSYNLLFAILRAFLLPSSPGF